MCLSDERGQNHECKGKYMKRGLRGEVAEWLPLLFTSFSLRSSFPRLVSSSLLLVSLFFSPLHFSSCISLLSLVVLSPPSLAHFLSLCAHRCRGKTRTDSDSLCHGGRHHSIWIFGAMKLCCRDTCVAVTPWWHLWHSVVTPVLLCHSVVTSVLLWHSVVTPVLLCPCVTVSLRGDTCVTVLCHSVSVLLSRHCFVVLSSSLRASTVRERAHKRRCCAISSTLGEWKQYCTAFPVR